MLLKPHLLFLSILYIALFGCSLSAIGSVPPSCIPMNLQSVSVESFSLLPNSKSCVNVINILPTYKFFVIEVHSQKKNVTLSDSSNNITLPNNSITGNGIGLVSVLNDLRTTVYWIENNNIESVNVRVTLLPYRKEAPIPGGCNMEFPVKISPFLKLSHKSGYTILEFQHAFIDYAPGTEPPSCSLSLTYISYDIYLLFLEEMNYKEDEYFRGIALMQDVASIIKHGKLVHPFDTTPRTRIKFSSYPGQGIVYSIIANYLRNNTVYQSAYVPYVAYDCSLNSEVDGCGRLTGPLAKVLAIALATIGLFISARGHRYLTIEMAYFGFLTFALVSFVLLSRFGGYIDGDRDIFTILGAIGGAVLWAGIWWFFGVPVISVLLVGFVLGFLLTSVLYFTPIGNTDLLRNDFNFWMILLCGVMIVPVFLLATTKFLNIFGCAVVGSYAVIVSVDRYIGTTLSYIVLNVVKRAVVDEFYLAANEVPFQKNDIILASTWFVLSVVMIAFQLYSEKGRAPFPPAPRLERQRDAESRRERQQIRRQNSTRTVHFLDSGNERTPLLASSIVATCTVPRRYN